MEEKGKGPKFAGYRVAFAIFLMRNARRARYIKSWR